MMQTKRPLARLAFQAGTFERGARMLPEEMAVALSYNGTTQAVMMATPAALEDFARGFTLTEGIAAPEEIDSITVVETDLGIDLQIWLQPEAEGRLAVRRRTMAGPVGCGLCGIDSLEEAVRRLPPVTASALRLTPAQVFAAVGAFALQANSRDAAVVATLPPGSYTAQVSGVGGTTGTAIVELYDLTAAALATVDVVAGVATVATRAS